MLRSLLLSGAVALGLAASPVQVLACEGETTVFDDGFDRLEPTWGEENDNFYVDGGELYIEPDADHAYTALSRFSYYKDADFCVTVTAVDADAEGDSYAGLTFWGIDSDNYYTFLIQPNGQAAVYRRQKGQSLVQVGWVKFDAIEKGAEEVSNEIRVVTKGKNATLYVNGKKFRQISGQPPANGWLIGLRAASSKKAINSYAYDDVKVTQ